MNLRNGKKPVVAAMKQMLAKGKPAAPKSAAKPISNKMKEKDPAGC